MGSIFKVSYNKQPRVFVDNGKRHGKKTEQSMHKTICSFLRKEYPGFMFRTDGAGMNLSKTQRGIFKSMQYGTGWPDLFIPHPSRGFAGLFLELKQPNTTIYLKTGANKGKLTSDEHIRNQAMILERLNKAGYFARFAVGRDQAEKIINWYFERPENEELPF